MIKTTIQDLIIQSLSNLDIEIDIKDLVVEQTNDFSNGDYTTNVAMRLASKGDKSPREIAQSIVDSLEKTLDIEKVEVAGPGFINFFLSTAYLQGEIKKILDMGGVEYLKSGTKEGKDILIEYTDPNPFKMMHVGHLYTNIVGESFSRLQEATGANVKRANYQGDVGLHVAKTMWGIEKKLKEESLLFKDIGKLSLFDRVEWLGKAYQLGSEYYDELEDEEAIEKIQDINYYLYQICYPSIPQKDFKGLENLGVSEWYVEGRKWCLEYFEEIYETLGTKFDYYFFEGEVGEQGYKMVLENIGNGIFKKDDGAIIYEGDPDKGLHTRVFVNQFGLPTYEAKELGLAKSKSSKGKWDESIMITGMEQMPYFKVVLDALGKLLPEIAKVSRHTPHGLIVLPGMKKMSSRKGEIINAEDLLSIAKESVASLMKENGKVKGEDIDDLAQKIAMSAIKYAFLRVSVGKNIVFDLSKDIAFDGDTGPYLMYVYTRAVSIINSCKVEYDSSSCSEKKVKSVEVVELMRYIGKAQEVVLNASTNYSPSTICTYLFELGQSFNRFYQNVNVLNAEEEDQKFLLALVDATAQIMSAGLNLLGITTVSRM
ncbi:arginine--tRNA ligase [bacterium]|nr:arginine--tRNA ligase [bacterium]